LEKAVRKARQETAAKVDHAKKTLESLDICCLGKEKDGLDKAVKG
jgi:hypothetical protein